MPLNKGLKRSGACELLNLPIHIDAYVFLVQSLYIVVNDLPRSVYGRIGGCSRFLDKNHTVNLGDERKDGFG